MIRGVAKVVVPVADQDRAVDFWTTRIGFRLVRDEKYGDRRWVEVAPADHSVVLVLRQREVGEAGPAAEAALSHVPVLFTCDDLIYTYQVLAARGVRFPMSPVREQVGWWAMFEDVDGTRFGLGQW